MEDEAVLKGENMTNQAVLEKAIQKAIDGGWMKGVVNSNPAGVRAIIKDNSENDIIFNHDFAKALWGEKPYYFVNYKVETPTGHHTSPPLQLEKWQYHLQQMVIADDPIKYLGENIK